jgi:outer membrane protein assembly factor BamB
LPDELTPHSPNAALVAYENRRRRSMRIYIASLAAIGLVAFVIVRTAYAHGELAHVTRRSAPAPAPIAVAPTAPSVQMTWQTDDHPAGGNPYSDGVVVTFDQHTVNGRDARSGAIRWFYRRSDRKICSVVEQDQSTIVIYNHDGNCDEVTGFDTATGKPKWYRTLTDNGISEASSAPNIVLIVTTAKVHVIDNDGGLDRWEWPAPSGCAVDRALGGSTGVLISYHCGTTHHLVLHDLTGATVKWDVTLNFNGVPVAASDVIAALHGQTGDLVTFGADKGQVLKFIPLIPAGQVASAIAALPSSQTSVERTPLPGESDAVQLTYLYLGRTLYALAAGPTILWSAPVDGPPWLITESAVSAQTGRKVTLFNAKDGRATQVVTVSPPISGSATAFPVGPGLLLAGTTAAMYQ